VTGLRPAARASFGARLAGVVAERGPLCVGVDPHPALLADWGLPATVAGLERFAMTCVEALAEHVAVLKPQSAFFEAFGSAGVAVLERLLVEARPAGALVLLDVKRGDIGSTMAAYARAYLSDESPLAADAVTLSPYLGFGSLEPAADLAGRTGRGVFVLALTSNAEGASVQRATAGGVTVAQAVVDAAAARNADARPLGDVGLVVGATVGGSGGGSGGGSAAGPGGSGGGVAGDSGLALGRLNGPILAPGLGAQGATVADLRRVFGSALVNVLPSSSRDVLRHGPDVRTLRDAALTVRDSLVL
jgi:orotidine-5'-phosphate decarboxylase